MASEEDIAAMRREYDGIVSKLKAAGVSESVIAGNYKLERKTMPDEFSVHRLNEDGLKKAEQIAGAFDALLAVLDGLGVGGRERAIVVTKMQEASFFAKRAIATQPANQLPAQ